MSKIKSLSILQKEIKKLKKHGKSIVFTNGCFDILHPGHIKILKYAKSKGDILVVGLNSDFSVKNIKGNHRPILGQTARAQLIEALEVVDFVIIFNENTPYDLIKKIQPDYLVKGEDWKADQIIGREFVKKVFRIKFFPGYSTTKIIEKIKNA